MQLNHSYGGDTEDIHLSTSVHFTKKDAIVTNDPESLLRPRINSCDSNTPFTPTIYSGNVNDAISVRSNGMTVDYSQMSAKNQEATHPNINSKINAGNILPFNQPLIQQNFVMQGNVHQFSIDEVAS